MIYLLAESLTSNEVPVAIAFMAAVGLLATVVAGMLVWQLGSAWRTRMAVGRERAYQELADEMAKSQRRTEGNLQRVLDELVDLRNRTAEIERVLKEVG